MSNRTIDRRGRGMRLRAGKSRRQRHVEGNSAEISSSHAALGGGLSSASTYCRQCGCTESADGRQANGHQQAQDTNKQKLAQYTWQETETISIKGSVKDTKIYQVQMVNGQQQKNPLSDQKAQSGGHEGRMKERMIEKKTEE